MATDVNEFIEIQISTMPWEQIVVDAFVCPTNSEGVMSHFPANKIRDLAGLVDAVEEGRGLAGQVRHQRHELLGGVLDVEHQGLALDLVGPGVYVVVRATVLIVVCCSGGLFGPSLTIRSHPEGSR